MTTREQLIESMGEETYKKLTAYILSGNSGRDLCDLYLEALSWSPGHIDKLKKEAEQQEQEIFEGESNFVETFDTMDSYPDSIIWG